MANDYDASLKHLLEEYTADWLPLLGRDPPADGRVRLLNVDLSTVVAAADQIWCLGVEEDLLHLEFQSSYDSGFARRAHLYNTLIHHRESRPVESHVLLLDRRAQGPAMRGVYQREVRGVVNLDFRFNVTRVWEQPAERFLQGGLGLLPLAAVVDDAQPRLPEIIKAIDEQLREVEPQTAYRLGTALTLLLGLRHEPAVTKALLERMTMGDALKHSTSWALFEATARRKQAALQNPEIFSEGKAEGKAEGRDEGLAEGRVLTQIDNVLQLGRRRFGEPDAAVRRRIEETTSLETLQGWLNKLFDATSWHDLLD